MSIFAKINTLITGTVICLVAVLGLMGYWLISSSGNENASKMLNVAQRAMQGDLDELTETQRLIATAIETDAGLAKVLAEKDTAALQRLAKQYVDEPIIDFFTAVDMSGTVLVRGHSNTKGDVLGSNLASGNIPLKQGRTAIGLETGQDFPLTLSAGVPIRYNGAQVGAIILGINLPDYAPSSANFKSL